MDLTVGLLKKAVKSGNSICAGGHLITHVHYRVRSNGRKQRSVIECLIDGDDCVFDVYNMKDEDILE